MHLGIEITDNDKVVIDHLINQKLNPRGLAPMELGQQHYVLTLKQEVMADLLAGADEGFYINRTRGNRFNKTYYTTKTELLVLLRDHIDDEQLEGLDLVVANEDFTWVFVTNHDGNIYKIR